ncbi:hypothetical protein C0992_001138, partial [Termitomyces sp. T32_za158]
METAIDPLAGFGPTAKEVVEQPQVNAKAAFFYPFLNASVFRLMMWYYAAKSLTLATLDRLVYTVILAPDFTPSDFEGFSATQENRRLDDLPTASSSSEDPLPPWAASDIWKKAS